VRVRKPSHETENVKRNPKEEKNKKRSGWGQETVNASRIQAREMGKTNSPLAKVFKRTAHTRHHWLPAEATTVGTGEPSRPSCSPGKASAKIKEKEAH